VIQRSKNSQKNGGTVVTRPKKFKTKKSSCKVLASVFWDKGVLLVLVDYVENGATITPKY
jgi:hypothetical protein